MDNLEELKKQISELQNKVNKLENQEKEKNKRWRAKVNDTYFYVDDSGDVVTCHEYNDDGDNYRYKNGDNYRYKTRNYFATYEEAEEYQEIMNTYYDLMDLAEELNKGRKIDWNNERQQKFYIYFNLEKNTLIQGYTFITKDMGQIYFLNENIIGIAIEKIGTDKLTKLFTYERN